MDLKSQLYALLLKQCPDVGSCTATGISIQALLWSDVCEERVYLSDKRIFSRLTDDESAYSTDFSEVKEQK